MLFPAGGVAAVGAATSQAVNLSRKNAEEELKVFTAGLFSAMRVEKLIIVGKLLWIMN